MAYMEPLPIHNLSYAFLFDPEYRSFDLCKNGQISENKVCI